MLRDEAGKHNVTGHIESPRWAKLPEYIRKLAMDLDLDIELQVEKRLINETVFFTVRGATDELMHFKITLCRATEEWNLG